MIHRSVTLNLPGISGMSLSCSTAAAIAVLSMVLPALPGQVGSSAMAGNGGEEPSVGPQVRLDTGGGTSASNETTIAVAESNPNVIVAAWNDWRIGGDPPINMGVALSTDGGGTWDDFLVRPPVGFQTNVEGDPMTAYDDRTGTVWVGAIAFSGGGQYVARLDPGDDEFQPSVMTDTSSGVDKCWMAAGPQLNQPDTTRLYIAYNRGIQWSDDMGDTWNSPTSLGSGIGFLPRVGSNGVVYVAYWNFSDGMMLKRSTNNGASFSTHLIATRMDVWGTQDGSRFPGTFRVPSMVYFDVDRDDPDMLYAAYFDTTNIVNGQRNVDIYFTTSVNQGTTWSEPVIANGDADPPGDQFWSWIEADYAGRIHMVYLDSRHTVQNDNVTNGMFDAYYAWSGDGGQTWSEHRLTPGSFNSNNDGLPRGSQFLGDYLGLSVAGC